MNRQARRLLVTGALLMALATLLGAFGAHSLRGTLNAGQFETFRTAVQYQFFHALGVLAIGLIVERITARSIVLAGWLLVLGVALFSGSLYAIVGGAPPFIGIVTPIGGLCLIAGWLYAAYAVAFDKGTLK
jgi:uncharacterized membrane protein YgdD (TMEM256/DUF423 family)